MRYKAPIQNHIFFFHRLGKIVFSALTNIIGAHHAQIIKQKVRLALKETPPPAVTSETERIIFTRLKDHMHVVFDVGIQNELSFYKIKNDCEYHLFEPNQKFIKLIKSQIATFKNHRIKLNECGLSDESRDDCVYYEESESFMINPTFKKGDIDTGKRYSVRILDGYVQENAITHIDFLKIDTEGFDYKVIRGAIQTIRRHAVSYIQFEYWDGVQKFYDILSPDFDLYLMMEPRLLAFIEEKIAPLMSSHQRSIDYRTSLIPLDKHTIDLIDNKIIPLGAGGNVLGIGRDAPVSSNDLTFPVER